MTDMCLATIIEFIKVINAIKTGHNQLKWKLELTNFVMSFTD